MSAFFVVFWKKGKKIAVCPKNRYTLITIAPKTKPQKQRFGEQKKVRMNSSEKGEQNEKIT